MVNLVDQLLFHQMYIKDDIIKLEVHDDEVGEIFYSDEARNITVFYIHASKNLAVITNPPSPSAMVEASKLFLKFMKDILEEAKLLEAKTGVGLDYDVQNERKISSLGWYAHLIRELDRHQKLLSDATSKYINENVSLTNNIGTQFSAGAKRLRLYRKHTRARYPQYASYNIQ